jgi:hypothetical protein
MRKQIFQEVVQFLAQLLAGEVQVYLDRIDRHLQDLRDLPGRQLFARTQIEHLPLSGRQTIKGMQGPAHLVLPGQALLGRRFDARLIDRQGNRLGNRRSVAAELIAPEVRGNPEEPDPDSSRVAELFLLPPGAEERFLGKVLGRVRIMRQAQREPIHARNILFQQVLHRSLAPSARFACWPEAAFASG